MSRSQSDGSGRSPSDARTEFDRRSFLSRAALVLAAAAWPLGTLAESAAAPEADPFARALRASQLVYVSPLRTDGTESTCHAEVWFVSDGADVLVVTNPERWRAAAITKGLERARLWAGDHGVWTRASKAWEKSPVSEASGRIDADREAHARALAIFGAKYASAWSKWGPRFEQGLASGERVLIRYTPDAPLAGGFMKLKRERQA